MKKSNRRGVLLLVVLALLAMFAMVAVAFVVLTGSEESMRPSRPDDWNGGRVAGKDPATGIQRRRPRIKQSAIGHQVVGTAGEDQRREPL